MGSKGQTTTSNQTSTYQPNPQAAGYITNALERANQAANLPFNIPQAPVAGFSPLQQQAFGAYQQGYNVAQPYYQQAAANMQAGPNVAQFFNPFASAVTGQLNNIFGQQALQNTSNLVGAAGGVGADRVAIGQANLANQQGLAAGQTLAGLYQPALGASLQEQQMQTQGLANLGAGAQQAALQGAGALYGAGAQQQLAQQQLNAPYQQQLAQAAFPYQQAQYLASITGALAPGLGGTTYGSGSQTAPGPSVFGQIAGLGLTGLGIYNQGQQAGWWGGGGGAGQNWNMVSAPGGGTMPMATSARGGRINPYQFGGEASDGMPSIFPSIIPMQKMAAIQAQAPQLQQLQPPGGGSKPAQSDSKSLQDLAGSLKKAFPGGLKAAFSPSGSSDTYGASSSDAAPTSSKDDDSEGFQQGGEAEQDDPVDISKSSIVPQSQLTPIQPHIPQLAPQQQSSGGGKGGGIGDVISTGLKLAMMVNRGGRINPHKWDGYANPYDLGGAVHGFQGGGSPTDEERAQGTDILRQAMWDQGYRPPAWVNETTPGATDAWRRTVDADRAMGQTAQADTAPAPLPPLITANTKPALPAGAMAYAPTGSEADVGAEPPAPPPRPRPSVASAAGAAAPPEEPEALPPAAKTPYSIPLTPGGQERMHSAAQSPWAALTAAGLGMLASRSPFFGVALGEGGLKGMEMLEQQRKASREEETTSQAAKRLQQEADFHADTMKHQRFQEQTGALIQDKNGNIIVNPKYMEAKEQEAEISGKYTPAGNLIKKSGEIVPLAFNPRTGGFIDGRTQKPIEMEQGDRVVPAKQVPVSPEDARNIASYTVTTGDFSRINGLGITSEARQEVQRQIHEVQKELGISDAELGTKKIEWEGRKAGARTLGIMEARMGAAATEAEGAIKQARGIIEKLPRTSFLPFNQLLEKYSKNTLNPDQVELYGRAQAIVNTYAAVMSRGANVTTDSARGHAEALLNTAGNPETFNRMLDVMQQEINMAKDSPMRMRQFYRERYNIEPGDASKEKQTQPTGGAGAPPAGGTTFTPPTGAVSRKDKNGKTWWFDPNTKQRYPGQ